MKWVSGGEESESEPGTFRVTKARACPGGPLLEGQSGPTHRAVLASSPPSVHPHPGSPSRPSCVRLAGILVARRPANEDKPKLFAREGERPVSQVHSNSFFVKDNAPEPSSFWDAGAGVVKFSLLHRRRACRSGKAHRSPGERRLFSSGHNDPDNLGDRWEMS